MTIEHTPELVVVGKISGVYGVHGWVKVFSYTEPLENILGYAPWYLQTKGEWNQVAVLEGKRHGKGLIVQLDASPDRDIARSLVKSDITVERSQLKETQDDEYYWLDLIGLEVVTTSGQALGKIESLMETGANDVLVVKGERERLIPYVPDEVVIEVDLKQRIMRVDWDPDFE